MKTLMNRVTRAIRDSRGATMAEYAILVAVIALVVILAARALGNSVSTKLGNAAAQIT
jgi:Flp pilus assembly pilin Flp